MMPSKTALVLNALLVIVMCWSILVITRMTHQLPVDLLVAFIPGLAWMISFRMPENRIVGGIAILINGFFALAGIFILVAFLLGAQDHTSVYEHVGFAGIGFLLLAVGLVNTRQIWRAFPPPSKTETIV